jgi:alpha-glucosidase
MTNNLPGVHPVMQEMRAWVDKFNSTTFPGTRVMIGETYLPNAVELAKQYGTPEKPEFHLPMDTQVTTINKMDVAAFRTKLTEAETELNGNTPLLLFDNHDNPRMDLRYGDGVHDTDIQRVLSTVLFASRGAAQMYYGDEIGMKTTPPTRKEDVKDPVGQLFWPMYKGRDGERTPMQWDATANAGFTTATATPWLPVPPNAATINAKAEQSDPASLFAWYQKLIELKKSNPALAKGDNTMLDTANTKVLSWVRQTAGAPAVVVSVNFTAEPQKVSLSVMGSGGKVKTLLKTPGAVDPVWLGQFELGPFGVFVGEVQ